MPVEKSLQLWLGDMQHMADILQKKERFVLRRVVNPLGQHNETYWRQEFELFMFG